MTKAGDPATREPCRSSFADAVTTDRLLGGQVVLRQPMHGYRAGTDAVLLAAAVPDPGEFVVDVGAGVGTVGIAVAVRAPRARLALVESDPAIASLARENIVLNGICDRASVIVADIAKAADRRRAGLFDATASLVVTNPPFFNRDQVRASPNRLRARAHVMARRDSRGELADWLRSALALLAPGGRFAMIHRPDALSEILQTLQGRVGAVRVLPVHPRRQSDASRIILTGIKGSRKAMAILPGFVLHGCTGLFTVEAEAIHRGTSSLGI